jgi:hypothetical protein
MECKLKLVRISSESKDTRDGVAESESMRLEGYDEAHGVEWTVTLKGKDEIPEEYKSVIGHQVNDSVIANIGPSAQQARLEA